MKSKRIKNLDMQEITFNLTFVNIKKVRNCAKAIGQDESFVLNTLLEQVDLIPLKKNDLEKKVIKNTKDL